MQERRLSRRESEIISLIAQGETTKAIAARLRISQNTVNWHVGNAFAKIGASSRAEAVAVAMRDGELDPAAGPRPPDPVPRGTSWRPLVLRVVVASLLALALAAQVAVATGTRVEVEVRRESPSPRVVAPTPATAGSAAPTANWPSGDPPAPQAPTAAPLAGAVGPATPPPTAPAATRPPAIGLPLPTVVPALPSLP